MARVAIVALVLASLAAFAAAQSYGYAYGYAATYGYGGLSEGSYAPAAPTYYYVTPTAAGGYYNPPTAPVYYYSAPPTVAPTFGYYTPSAPTYYYYYTAPPVSPPPPPRSVAPTVPPTYTPPPTVAPTTCPVCPTCPSPSTTSGRRLQSSGQCYCPYDREWNAWAVADPHCRATLYSKCQTDSRLECEWLDAYFSSDSTENGFTRPHEGDIYNFLYNDCPPAKPCSCSSLTFSGRDAAADVYRCCSDLQVHAQVPFSGLARQTVDAFCGGNSIPEGQKLKSWVQHSLWHAECPVRSADNVYTFKAAVAKAEETRKVDVVEPTELPQKLPVITHLSSHPAGSNSQPQAVSNAVAGAVGALAGAVLAAVVMLLVMQFNARSADGYISMV